jgi:hypothetical protein
LLKTASNARVAAFSTDRSGDPRSQIGPQSADREVGRYSGTGIGGC